MTGIVLALLAAGCGEISRPRGALLPTHVCILVEQDDGAIRSLLLDVRHDLRDQLDVRVAEGAHIFDGRQVWALTTLDGLGVVDAKGGKTRLPIEGTPRLLAVARGEVWFDTPGRPTRCSLKEGTCAEADVPPVLTLDHQGPGPGFRVALEGDVLELALPSESEGQAILTGVRRLVGVGWVRARRGAPDAILNRTFRGRARIGAMERPLIVADGDVAEWTEAAPLVVDDAWQLERGARFWSGHRDASFSIAAARAPGQLCFAGRVRDDVPTAADAMEINLGGEVLRFSLSGGGSIGGGDGAAAVRPDWHGATYEACFPEAAFDGSLSFSATMEDKDDDRPPTRLSSAPSVDGMPLGSVFGVRGGVEPAAPRSR